MSSMAPPDPPESSPSSSPGGPPQSGRCPHCGAFLPQEGPAEEAQAAAGAAEQAGEAAAVHFCPSCGRRVEGWRAGYRATLGGASAGGALPGGEEPTRAITPSPSLLAAVAASKGAAKTTGSSTTTSSPTDSVSVGGPAVRPSRLPLIIGLVVAGFAVAALALMRSPRTGQGPAPIVDNKPILQPLDPPSAPQAPPKKAGKARRISAPPIAGTDAGKAGQTKPVATNGVPTKAGGKTAAQPGGLPHKEAKKTDSKSTDVGGAASGTGTPSAGTGALPMAANETVENESKPMNETERRAENAARADADGVRFVVHSHLPQVQACYGRAFKESSPGGRVDIGFVVTQAGKASKIRTESNTSGAAGLARCLEQRIGEWDFPRPSSGEFELIYPFVFSPGS